ncbi:hypothetical protein BD311DRAFT_782045 [Dichomitus squalens]|uniref:Uncharacterized protein n=1 Tax=Dichomitus squalens TaxID=114155 RepID=A0A4Q9M7A6_9APHY|nr:hypothetical protein BD311DRAFT_782045 [Dichomitus squalens]
MLALATTSLVTLSFAASAAALSTSGRRVGHAGRIAGGAIAGIIIGCIAFVLLLLLCCCLCLRSRRSSRAGGAAPSRYGGFSSFGRSGRNAAGNGMGDGAVGPGAQEAGYGTGPVVGQQGNYNDKTQPAYGGQYQPPMGAPPNAPQPGGFAAVSRGAVHLYMCY